MQAGGANSSIELAGGPVTAPLEAAWESIRNGLRRDLGARTGNERRQIIHELPCLSRRNVGSWIQIPRPLAVQQSLAVMRVRCITPTTRRDH